MRRTLTVAVVSCCVCGPALAETVKVNAFNFARAESDTYLAAFVNRNDGLNLLRHDRSPTPIDEQSVVRINRDTFYSSTVHDLDAGPVTVTMPENLDGRFQSMQAITQDHYTPFVIYEGLLEVTKDNVGTRYVALAFRTFVDPNDEADIAAAYALQDGIQVEQASDGSFDVPQWDKGTQSQVRSCLAELQALGGTDQLVRMGKPDRDDPVAHLMATATGFGLNPLTAAIYFTRYPTANDGSTVHQMAIEEISQDGFWSLSVYEKDGFFAENALQAYSLNNVTAVRDANGIVNVQFGGCEEATPNCLPITEGWNYSLRVYHPRSDVLDGRWTPPEAVPLQQ